MQTNAISTRLDNATGERENAGYADRRMPNDLVMTWRWLGLSLATLLALTAFPAMAAAPGELAPDVLGMDRPAIQLRAGFHILAPKPGTMETGHGSIDCQICGRR